VATSLVVGGSSGLGRFIAEHRAEQGDDVIITSRNPRRAQEVAAEIGGTTRGLAVTLAQPATIAAALAGIDQVDNLGRERIVRLERDQGVQGLGEGSLEGREQSVEAVVRELARYFVGQD
jgi:NAD(P)-dependent dehydrogenase (short-subunit alcohol dehydrogenase family)